MMHYNSQSQSSGTESFEHHEQGSTVNNVPGRPLQRLGGTVNNGSGDKGRDRQTGRQSDRQTGK